jgi:hypothetical protein
MFRHFRHRCFPVERLSLRKREICYCPIPQLQYSREFRFLDFCPCGSLAEVTVQPHSQPRALQARLLQYSTACNYISLIRLFHLRFDGVVGYRICLTHRRSPVRTRVEPFFSLSSRAPFSGLRRRQRDHTCISFYYLLALALALAKRNENAPIRMQWRCALA